MSHTTMPSTVFGGMSIESSSSYTNERIRQRSHHHHNHQQQQQQQHHQQQQPSERQQQQTTVRQVHPDTIKAADTTQSTKSSSTGQSSCAQHHHLRGVHAVGSEQEITLLGRMLDTASQAMDSLYKSAAASSLALSSPSMDDSSCARDEKLSIFEQLVQEPCSPCTSLKNFTDSPPRKSIRPSAAGRKHQENMSFSTNTWSDNKKGCINLDRNFRVSSNVSKDTTEAVPYSTPFDRRKQRHHINKATNREIPVECLTVKEEDSYNLEKSISELTMKSSHGGATTQVAENRRMAYYAVGKHHKNNGRGGNRRCYFTGKLILNGSPFYAGSVQQGLRTLVVFCLPSAVGLPKVSDEELNKNRRQRSDLTRSIKRQASDITKKSARSVLSGKSSKSAISSIASSQGGLPLPRHLKVDKINRVSTKTSQSLGSVLSRATSMDDMSFLEEELDKNWDIERDYLLKVLPTPSQDLLNVMAARYPNQFETLPFQVRSSHSWRLFIKFCFFSGLPIAEGEMHYKVIDEISSEVYGEEIVLSHEVMEAVHGEASAEILRLPNLKTFKYLRKHYTQQSAKLSEIVFQRASWELVRPEV